MGKTVGALSDDIAEKPGSSDDRRRSRDRGRRARGDVAVGLGDEEDARHASTGAPWSGRTDLGHKGSLCRAQDLGNLGT